jgi:hypothetical protein
MLVLPTVGMRVSINEHNINFPAFCDWIEGNIIFDGEALSGSDVIDVLLEEGVYEDQDFAWEIVGYAWSEIERRQRWAGAGAAVELGKKLKPLSTWRERPAVSFCLALSYATWYPAWAKDFGTDFNEQGDLFEELTKESLEKSFPDWEIYRTGWTKTTPTNLNDVVKELISRLNEEEGNLETWTSGKAHEAGLDLLCYRSFGDARVGVPLFLMQCASGGNWESKLRTPDLRIWTKIIHFASDPKKAFAMPFSLTDKDFRQHCNIVDGMFLDRHRLLAAGKDKPDWVSIGLRDRLITWLEPRILALPRVT